VAQETERVAPISAYPLLTSCLLASSALSNMSLNYINFPTKVVFRSCKLIPTMVVASVVHKKVFTSVEYFCALAVCAGLIFFAAADWQLTPSFHPIGLAFVSLSVCADAILPNAQERLFRLGSSRLEVIFYTNIFTLIAMTVTTLLSGDLLGLIDFAKGNRKLLGYMVVYTFIAYIAISLHMNVVKRFGGVAAVVLATGRKGMTLVLSFILFPKSFSWFYVMGALLVLGGLMVSSLAKIYSKSKAPKTIKRKESEREMANDKDIEHTPLLSTPAKSMEMTEPPKSSAGLHERHHQHS
jgi:adenosine 3'-phospho 5'-phosphosulfate transporter B3